MTRADQACQEGVGRNVEGHAQAHVARTLIHLARQLAAISVNVELAEHVAGRQRHNAQVRRVPCCEQNPSVVWVRLDGVDDVCLCVRVCVCVCVCVCVRRRLHMMVQCIYKHTHSLTHPACGM
jgi:hypothetical protein